MYKDFNFSLKTINLDTLIMSRKNLDNLKDIDENNKQIIALLQNNSDVIIKEINENFDNNYKMFIYLLIAEKALEDDYDSYYDLYLNDSPISVAKAYIEANFNDDRQYIDFIHTLCTMNHIYSLPLIYHFKRIVKDIINSYFYKLRILNISELNYILKLIKKIIYSDNFPRESEILSNMFNENNLKGEN